ncbi:MAG TPA: DUF6496 domain-containing protein [Thermodesulfobacteriota bacterium]|nr:DUF6496 domain-containing protein [Thermodesulfobacteriota bacterium]
MAEYGRKSKESVRKAMEKMKQGKLKSGRSGKTVRNPKQAVAIGLSEARRKGAKAPPAPSKNRKKRTSSRGKPERKGRKTASRGQITTSHATIQEWAEQRNGKPTRVKGTGDTRDAGILRIDFPGYSGKGSLEEISWDEFFEKFEENNLAFLYQDKTASGRTSRFNKLVSREESGGH